jgi:hypothetical protein
MAASVVPSHGIGGRPVGRGAGHALGGHKGLTGPGKAGDFRGLTRSGISVSGLLGRSWRHFHGPGLDDDLIDVSFQNFPTGRDTRHPKTGSDQAVDHGLKVGGRIRAGASSSKIASEVGVSPPVVGHNAPPASDPDRD